MNAWNLAQERGNLAGAGHLCGPGKKFICIKGAQVEETFTVSAINDFYFYFLLLLPTLAQPSLTSLLSQVQSMMGVANPSECQPFHCKNCIIARLLSKEGEGGGFECYTFPFSLVFYFFI